MFSFFGAQHEAYAGLQENFPLLKHFSFVYLSGKNVRKANGSP